MNITVLGAGSWGTTLAILLSENQHAVSLWAHREEFSQTLNADRENKRYLKGIPIPHSILITHSPDEAISGAFPKPDVIVTATPSQAVRETLLQFQKFNLKESVFVNVAKGIEVHSGLRMSEVIQSAVADLHPEQIAVLYGPSHAEEVSQKRPTTVVAASSEQATSELVQSAFMTPMFRVYVNSDVVGVEIAGSVKNVMAIAAGIADGVGYGDNAKAAIITRGLAEIARLGVRLGANPLTFSGLAGIGDLVVTCASRHSRNRYVGEQIGKGRKLSEIISEMVMVAEGVSTTKAVSELAQKLGVEMPITQAVFDMLFENKPARHAVFELMTRDPKDEML
ncbi:MAG: NAD(P)H-dependent glycerol-3-phosphate dehydrogenase [Rhizobacter sp.]|nr:NAD(P)H-dependent glycerol-3-phosphate dehydrogenase [Chlorobiales bacterium]